MTINAPAGVSTSYGTEPGDPARVGGGEPDGWEPSSSGLDG